jgi:poly-gamma-glutamate synthesis protein (capsule biosynthesis protein)
VPDARSYVTSTEEASGPIPRPADFAWPWGEALRLVDELMPDVRLLNLETTITADGQFPANPCTTACTLTISDA